MLERQRKTKDPCPVCRLHKARCLCAHLPVLDLRTRVELVIHAKELKRTTNTGRLAMHALRNSAMHVRGDSSEPQDLSALLEPTYQPLLLYPAADAHELSVELVAKFARPIRLIVPDGNWRQASKVHTRQRELRQVPRVKLRQSCPSAHVLRTETMPDGMATLEAIAHALSILEGDSVGSELMALYFRKLKATLQGRGLKVNQIDSGESFP